MTHIVPRGPWDFVEGKTLLHIETAHDHPDGAGQPICSVPKSKRALAQFLIAAPDMAEALFGVSLMRGIGALKQFEGEPWLEKVETALARARGETP